MAISSPRKQLRPDEAQRKHTRLHGLLVTRENECFRLGSRVGIVLAWYVGGGGLQRVVTGCGGR